MKPSITAETIVIGKLESRHCWGGMGCCGRLQADGYLIIELRQQQY
jgi:hypothetical protein